MPTRRLTTFYCDSRKPKRPCPGFSLIELLIVVGIILVIAALAVPKLYSALYLAKVSRAGADMNALEKDILQYQVVKGALPATLADIGRSTLLDPWGHPYQYANLLAAGAVPRTDRFGIPVNDDFDLYSMGADGLSATSLTAAVSQDDVIFAADGSYIGLASDY
jgi:general secretion pathway protein G